MGKRGHGEGSIYQRKDGRWVACMTLESHKRKYFYGDTRREVQEQLKKALHEQQQGTLATGKQQLLKAFLEQWLEEVYKPTVRPSTYVSCQSYVRRHLIPAFGHIILQKLTAASIQSHYTKMLKDGLKPRTIIAIHSSLHGALETAVKWGLVPRNVAKLVALPRVERYQAQTLTLVQAHALLERARGSQIETLLLMALTTGMRRGELLGLHWDDIDFEQGIVYIRHSMSWVKGHGYYLGEPKTKTSRRKIVLSNVVLESLKAHREQQEQMRLKKREKWHEQGIVFCNSVGGFFNPSRVLTMFQEMLGEAGLPHMRFHDLRHSAATILLAAKVHPKVVQERLGHSTIVMTMDIYSHVLPSMQQEVAEKIDDLFKH